MALSVPVAAWEPGTCSGCLVGGLGVVARAAQALAVALVVGATFGDGHDVVGLCGWSAAGADRVSLEDGSAGGGREAVAVATGPGAHGHATALAGTMRSRSQRHMVHLHNDGSPGRVARGCAWDALVEHRR